MIEPSDVARLRELEARATPGPWLVGLEDWWGVTGWVVGREAKEPGMVGTVVATSGAGHAPDADLIAAMRNALPGLLDAIEALRLVLLGFRDGGQCWCGYAESIGEHAFWCRDASAALDAIGGEGDR